MNPNRSVTCCWRTTPTISNSTHPRPTATATVRGNANSSTPSTREQAAAERILINKENGDIVVLIPKLQKDQGLNYDGSDEFLTDVIEELGKERSEIDPNDVTRPDNRIHNFGKHQR